MPGIGFAQPSRLFDHRREYRCEIARRRIDDLEDLGGRGLPFERLAGFRDEPRVLDRDYRLCAEILQQGDLLVGERVDVLSVRPTCPAQLVVFEQPLTNKSTRPPAG